MFSLLYWVSVYLVSCYLVLGILYYVHMCSLSYGRVICVPYLVLGVSPNTESCTSYVDGSTCVHYLVLSLCEYLSCINYLVLTDVHIGTPPLPDVSV